MMIIHDFDRPKHVCKCRLESGEIVEYDAAARRKNAYSKKIFRWIGKGVICEIDGVPQEFTRKEHFFVYVVK